MFILLLFPLEDIMGSILLHIQTKRLEAPDATPAAILIGIDRYTLCVLVPIPIHRIKLAEFTSAP